MTDHYSHIDSGEKRAAVLSMLTLVRSTDDDQSDT